jgi:DNA-binding MarR family transcriptional regulator
LPESGVRIDSSRPPRCHFFTNVALRLSPEPNGAPTSLEGCIRFDLKANAGIYLYMMRPGIRCHCTDLRRAARQITRLYDERLSPAGLTAAQYSLMRAISKVERPSLTDLGAFLDLDRSTLGRNLRPLQQAGLVRVSLGEDRRERTISVTAKGKVAIDTAMRLWTTAQAEVEEALGPALVAKIAEVATELELLVNSRKAGAGHRRSQV